MNPSPAEAGTFVVSSPIVEGLSQVVLHSLWQALLAALLYASVCRTIRLTARARHALGFGLLAALPLAAAIVFVRTYVDAAAPMPALAGNLGSGAGWLAALAGGASVAAAPAESGGWPTWGNGVVVALWGAGAGLLLLRQLGGLIWLRRTLRRAEPLPAPWLGRARRLARALGVPRPVRFVAAQGAGVPFAFGWLRPVVVVPLGVLAGLSPAHLDLVLMHELAHLRRSDFLAHLAQVVVESVFFYHPAVWWLGRRLREERELACDAAVVARGADPLTYARALTELEIRRGPHLAVPATGGDLMRRVRAIVTGENGKPSARGGVVAAVILTLVIGGVGAACLGAGPDASATPATAVGHDLRLGIPWLPPSVRRHEARIVSAAAARGVDPALLALMVLVESGGDPTARSPLGARGLMQLLPSTAARVARRAGIRLEVDDLDEPATNLSLGARLVRELLDTFRDRGKRQLELALASYNAGTAAVRRHLAGAPLRAGTRRYVSLLLSLYRSRRSPSSAAYEAWRRRAHTLHREAVVHPLPGSRITSPFGRRVHPFGKRAGFHRGLDLAQARGTPIRAPLAGTVVKVQPGGDARGIFLVIRHGVGLQTRYHHLETAKKQTGDGVAAGEVIGTVGSSGVSSGPHLHLEVLDHGKPVDPALLLGAKR